MKSPTVDTIDSVSKTRTELQEMWFDSDPTTAAAG